MQRLRDAAESRGDDLLARLLVEAALALEQLEAEAAGSKTKQNYVAPGQPLATMAEAWPTNPKGHKT